MSPIAIIVAVANLALFFLLVRFFHRRVQAYTLANYFLPGLILKILAGIALGLIYTNYYYGGDTLGYYNQAAQMATIFYESPLDYFKLVTVNKIPEWSDFTFSYEHQPRAFFNTKMVSVFNIITYNEYRIVGMWMSLFSYLGIWYLANTLAVYFPKTRLAAALAFLFLPSVVFWSSGILKEAFVMPAICTIVAFAIPYLVDGKKIPYPKVLLITFLVFLLLKLKYYYIGVLVPVLIASILTTWLRSEFPKLLQDKRAHLAAWVAIFSTVLLAATNIHPRLSFGYFLNTIIENHDVILSNSQIEDIVIFEQLEPTWTSALFNAPKAIFAGLFRPLFYDASSTFQWVTAIENTCLLLLSVASLVRIKMIINTRYKVLVFSAVVFITILSLFLTLSAPNFGTLARYKVAYLPFFAYLMFCYNPLIDFFARKFELSVETERN